MKLVQCFLVVVFVVISSQASWFSHCVLKGKFGYCTKCASYTVSCPCDDGKPRCKPYCEVCGSSNYIRIFTGSQSERFECMKRLKREVQHYKQLLQDAEKKGDEKKIKRYKREIEERLDAIAEIRKDLKL